MTVLTLRDDFTGTGGDSASLDIAGRTLVALYDWRAAPRLVAPATMPVVHDGATIVRAVYRGY